MATSDFTPIGSRFSRLVVTSEYWSDKFYIRRVRCICDCGKETEASCQQLVKGIKKSCGCLKVEVPKRRAEDRIAQGVVRSVDPGQRFGRLVVTGQIERRNNGSRYVQCACDCGGTKLIGVNQLRSGKTRSCGCLVRESNDRIHPVPIGQRFGNLVVLRKSGSRARGRMVEAQCDCGNITIANINNLRSGHTASCGCLKSRASEKRAIHGHTRKGKFNRTYAIYRDMRTRCENPNYREFHLYGGRGITVCERWRQGYEFFLADMGERPPGMTLERNRVNEGYSPENCCWASPAEQSVNKRNNVFIEHEGRRMTVSQWAAELGLNAKRMYYGVKQGWPPEKLLAK